MEVTGRCDCKGHANGTHCPLNQTTGLRTCQCQGNTCGAQCDQCCPLYNQILWKIGNVAPWNNDPDTSCERKLPLVGSKEINTLDTDQYMVDIHSHLSLNLLSRGNWGSCIVSLFGKRVYPNPKPLQHKGGTKKPSLIVHEKRFICIFLSLLQWKANCII